MTIKKFLVEIETENENNFTRLSLWSALKSYFKNANPAELPYVQITEIKPVEDMGIPVTLPPLRDNRRD